MMHSQSLQSDPAQKSTANRARFARLFLLGGLAFAVSTLLPSVPREQILLFRLEQTAGVKKLNATWTVPGRSEPSGGVTLHFNAQSPRNIRHALSLPNGPYVLDISIERTEGSQSVATSPNRTSVLNAAAGQAPGRVDTTSQREPLQTNFVRRVNLEGGETVIRL